MWGRVLGTAFGFIFGKVAGAVLGFVIGYWFDWKYGKPLAGHGGFSSLFSGTSEAPKEATFFYALFAAHGHIAKAKGRISEQDIAEAQQLMNELELSGSALDEARDAFREGKSSHFPLVATLTQFRRDYHNRRAVLQSFMLQLIALLIRAQPLTKDAYELLLQVATTLGFTRFELDRWLLMESAQQQFDRFVKYNQRRATVLSADKHILSAYSVLGIEPKVTDQELKIAYRKLMSEHHPDKLAAQGLPEEMLANTTRRAQEIQAAYALIRNSRAESNTSR
ncbi:co-chaperone DjlA [Aliidiomarina quisquiliarum]|uniref:co-chaperone DjlA n=1 Tax=Aliidiomarina quisquiliarum TaxID=2938947 RepID=UPI00208F8A48|nr:co-chaperone DjlA [Aliidiomarina quisquiliarum]MCO4322634.1 co-chaperone DjlA [Aliidiomarina quisquiliarum]